MRDHVVFGLRGFYPRHSRYLCLISQELATCQDAYSSVNHEPQDILYAVKCQNTTIHTFPHLLVIHVAALNRGAQLVDVLRICDCDFQIRTLLIALEAEQILPHHHLD